MLFSFFLSCLLLGALVGFLAGLLGIGGGLLIVPALVYLLPQVGVSPDVVMPIALGTSLGTIVVTSASAVRAHHKNRNIPWSITRQIMSVIAVGALAGAFIADELSSDTLAFIFATAVILLATYMLVSIRNASLREMPPIYVLQATGLFTGIMASLMGIAGGAILVPALSYFGMQLRQTIGVATACGLVPKGSVNCLGKAAFSASPSKGMKNGSTNFEYFNSGASEIELSYEIKPTTS